MSETERIVLRASGKDAPDFLQNLVSNDVSRASSGPVYAALLTPQGKYLADFFLLERDGAILIDVAASLTDGLLARLNMYRLRADVRIEKTDLVVARGSGTPPPGAYADPRSPRMGWRGYDGQASDDTDWDAARVEDCVPLSGVELGPDSYLLECGFERLHGVDFRKGCYVGQEVTARMKHKTDLRKGLARVAVDGHAPVGCEILAGDKPAGTLFTQSGGFAIAFLRFDRSDGPLRAGDATVTWTN